MGRQLYDTQPVFKAAIDHCDELLQPYLDLSLQSLLFGEDGGAPLHQTGYTQPACSRWSMPWPSFGCPGAFVQQR
jgi:acyl transferase domain-containing protein